MPEKLTTMRMDVDELDERSINRAISVYQTRSFKAFGEIIIPEGGSDQRAAIIGEICRGWIEMTEAITSEG